MTAINVAISQGTTIAASANQPATEDIAGYVALTFVDIAEVTSFGESGGTATVTTFTPVNSGIVNKRKGSKDYGTMSLGLASDIADAGQVMLKAGFDGATEQTIHSFEVTDNAGNITYFMGLISSFTTIRGDANAIISHNCNIERTSIAVDDPA